MKKFNAEKHIFSIWHNHTFYLKEEYRDRTINKKIDVLIPWKCESASYIKDSTLFLQENLISNQDYLFLEYQTNEYKQDFSNFFQIIDRKNKHILKLKALNSVNFGYPLRESFEVVPLDLLKPVRVCINARQWHSHTSRKETIYLEWDFILEYMGSFGTYILNNGSIAEQYQPISQIKVIDLRKKLY